jgi:thiol-disulfide isomerase/thioredoxin
MAATEPAAAARSQSAVSPVLLWALLAAVVLRVVTGVMDRAGDGPGLIRWQAREGAAAQAARLGKPLLYDFTAAWCAPCKQLDADWEDAAVAEQVNATFVPVRIVDRMREEGRNAPEVADLQRRYEISVFPTLVVAAPDGRLIAKREGYRNTAALVSFLRQWGQP